MSSTIDNKVTVAQAAAESAAASSTTAAQAAESASGTVAAFNSGLNSVVAQAATDAATAAADEALANADEVTKDLILNPSQTKTALTGTIAAETGETAAGSGGININRHADVNLIGASTGTANTIAGGGTTSGAAAATPNLPPASPFINAILGTMTAGVSTIGGGYDNVIDADGAGANTIAGGAHHRILGVTTDHGSIGGGSWNTIENCQYATVVGGTNNKATGTYATIIGGDGHLASGTNSAVLGGKQNNASGSQATVFGLTSTASGANSVAGGRDSIASGAQSVALGYGNTASGTSSVATGERSKATAPGQWAHAAGRHAVDGDAQASLVVLRRETVDDTLQLTAPSYQPQDGAATAYRGTIVARDVATGESKMWTVSGLLRRSGSVVTQVGGAPTFTVVAEDTAAAPWTLITYTGTGTFAFRVTGEAGKTIHWTCRLDTAEAA